MSSGPEKDLETARRVMQIEREALDALSSSLDANFAAAVDAIVGCEGYLIVAGVGKSGHIGQKIAATMASTGTPSFFLHPTEASHGDLGMVRPDSVVLAISYSGETRELIDLLRYCRSHAVKLIAMTRSADSLLGRNADILLALPEHEEACPNGLAPTSSTTMTLVMGDALAVALMARRGFSPEDFGARHPGGKLGKALHTVADYLMSRDGSPPMVSQDAGLRDVIQAIAEGRQGCVAVVDGDGRYIGIVTDGDLRRYMQEGREAGTAREMMTRGGKTFAKGDRIALVVDVMTKLRISNGFVLEDGKPVGIIHTKDLLEEGYI
ncbi:MAG TPA: KpsF/GutQ family sugar-phosphate isomerase [Henriciella marina]|uniref:KpsF/GutQ family sugar-phosphate isomerase n=1 Tax=Henriciella sp. TaxID=1968823 RepID=UPI0017B459CD|nr:KpsF/GutQ family sugar-phosphate isomerase [Henriciella sp.]HIG23732.1 KpsF/GutQ family sugar-phosphate isomerase [Henriciella sp.]HIK63840.1 KpsF/GutQ family sugar-phosphate isomerase [Henriciella marina]